MTARFISQTQEFSRREPWIVLMMISIILVLFFSAIFHVPQETMEETSLDKTSMEIKKIGGNIARDMEKNQPLYIRVAFAIMSIFCLGLLINVVFWTVLREGFQKKLKDSRLIKVPWFVIDVLKVFVVFFFSEIAISFIHGLASGIWDLGDSESALIMATTFLRNAVVVVYICWLVRRHYKAPLRVLGMKPENSLRNVLFGLLSYVGFLPVYMLLLFVIMIVLKILQIEPPVQDVTQIVYQEQKTELIVLFSIFIAVIGPFFEEVLFRGFVYQAFKKKWGVIPGAVAVSILFAVLHAHWVALVPIFALSLALCFVFEVSQSIIPCTALHMAHNLAALGILLQVKSYG